MKKRARSGSNLEKAGNRGRRRVTILVVEDSPTQAEHLKLVLRQKKYRVSVARNGMEALEKINMQRPAIVISDIVMPEMDGYELCRQIKGNQNLKDIPVLLLTSLSDPKDVLKGLECGANSFIVKPFEVNYLISRIQYVLANEELRRKESFRVGIEIFFAEQKYFITSDRVQILDLLLSTYESAVLRNSELAQIQEELRKLNEDLERKVEERTSDLNAQKEALSQSEERKKTILESALDCIITLDHEWRIVEMNPAAERTFGCTLNEAMGTPIVDLMILPSLRESHGRGLAQYLATGEGHIMGKRMEIPAVRADGSEFPAEMAVVAIQRQDPPIFTAFIRDITERKQAEALQSALYRIAEKTSLAEDIQEFYAAIHGIVGELMYARNFYIALYDNHKISFPYFVDEVDSAPDPEKASGGLTGYVLRTGKSLLVSQEAFDEMVERGETEEIGEPSNYWLGVPLKTGEKTFGVLAVQSYSEDVGFGEKEKDLLTFVSQHIAAAIERKRQQAIKMLLEEQLLQAQKMEAVGRLAGGVAHDFNNTLMAINAYSEMILQVGPDSPQRRSVLEIRKATEQGANLTRQLLAFSRKQILTPKILDLNHSISQMEDMLRRLVGEDVELATVLNERLDQIKADQGQIEQVIMNLAVNARDAMPNGGKLTIETANVELDEAYTSTHAGVTPGSYVMLAVHDTGQGMDEATVTRIFEPFFTTKEEGKGTGLGLSTVYGIVQQSGAHIWVYSEIGRGTIFKIYFPSENAKSAKSDNATVVSRKDDLEGRGQVILLVDDNESIRAAIATLLERNGYSVLQANSGEKALELSRNQDEVIHLMITDIVMPKMTGLEVAESVRSARPEIKILFISGYTDNEYRRHPILASGAAFLQKPASIESLLRKIRELLQNKDSKGPRF